MLVVVASKEARMVAMAERYVMVVSKRRDRLRVRYSIDGVHVTEELHGGRYLTKIEGRVYCNMAFPTTPAGLLIAPLSKAICPRCGYGYSERMRDSAVKPCAECAIEYMAERAMELERAGIPMGWGYCGRDENTVTSEYRYERAIMGGWKQATKGNIDKGYGARSIRNPNG